MTEKRIEIVFREDSNGQKVIVVKNDDRVGYLNEHTISPVENAILDEIITNANVLIDNHILGVTK